MVQSKIRIIILLACCILAACQKEDVPNGNGSDRKIQGTLNPADFARPLVKRPMMLNITGCCSLDIKTAKAEQLNSDSQVIIIKGEDFEAELVFGFNEALDKSSKDSQSSVSIDGVVFEKLLTANTAETRMVWQTIVPLAASAKVRGVVDPILKINGRCRSGSGCWNMERTINTIRF
jgi:hypothetical protein